MSIRLVVRLGDRTLRFPLAPGEQELGSSPECGIRIGHPTVSRRHAAIVVGDGVVAVTDLGSSNGTRVDGSLVRGWAPLASGQKVFVGRTVIRFSLADPLEVDFHREVEQLVSTDPLTGLESKQSFDCCLDQALALARERHRPLAILMMDLDRVKPINDTHGHLFGAYCIQKAGEIIGRAVGTRGHACRIGGDEFTAFLPGHGSEEGRSAAEAIRRAVERAGLVKDGIPLRPTISIGVAAFPEHGEQTLDLIAAADQALYRAKAKGKNCVSD
jgi:diguanylate cyclase (GGDEF)-like protein